MENISNPKPRTFALSKLFHFGDGASLWEPLTRFRGWNAFLWCAIALGAGLWLLVWQIPVR